ncbi:MAG: nucleotidyltransferase domain-containing protein [Candidatus Bathyarchaeia archaeon]
MPCFLAEPLERLVKALRKMDPEAEVYLCGSYARGDWLRDSDVDLVVVSEIFDGLDLGARFALVKRLMEPGFSLDLLTYTPREFKEAKGRSAILGDMLSYSLKVVPE